MLSKLVLLFFFLSILSTTKAQYLEFDNIIHLINIAEERDQVENYLKINGFDFYNLEFINQEDDEDTSDYRVDYVKKLAEDEYFIRVVGEVDEDIFSVGEYSDNEDRWDYYVSVISAADLDPVDTWDRDGEEGYKFETEDYIMTLKRELVDGNMRYSFFISGY